MYINLIHYLRPWNIGIYQWFIPGYEYVYQRQCRTGLSLDINIRDIHDPVPGFEFQLWFGNSSKEYKTSAKFWVKPSTGTFKLYLRFPGRGLRQVVYVVRSAVWGQAFQYLFITTHGSTWFFLPTRSKK